MSRNRAEDRPTLRQRLSSPGWKRFFRIAGLTLVVAACALLLILIITVLTQPADRAFTRPGEWLVIGLIALPAVLILLIALIAGLRWRRKRARSTPSSEEIAP